MVSRSQDKLKRQQRETTLFVKETFATPAGKKTLHALMGYYEQALIPGNSETLAFHCGQRDVVQWIVENMKEDDRGEIINLSKED